MLLRLVEDKFRESYNIQLTKKQKTDLMLNFEEHGLESLNQLNINLNRAQMSHLKKLGQLDLVLDFTELDFDKINKKIEGASTVAMDSALNFLSDAIVKEWKKGVPTFLRNSKSNNRNFLNTNRLVWGKALDMLESFVDLSLDAGEGYFKKYQAEAVQNNNLVFDVLVKLHARGCQVGSEIMTLLRAGFADGAHARWRTLHELSVIASFISKNDNVLAQRYIDHIFISDYQHAIQYREYSEELSYAPMPDEIFEKIKLGRESIIKKYNGDSEMFKNDYWWASVALKNNNRRPNFTDIEDAIEIKFMRPFVKLAHWNIHAGSKGLVYRLGLPLENDNMLLAGSSVFGIAQPAQNTAFSMNLLTFSLFSVYSNFENVAFVSAYEKFMNQVSWAFDRTLEKQIAIITPPTPNDTPQSTQNKSPSSDKTRDL